MCWTPTRIPWLTTEMGLESKSMTFCWKHKDCSYASTNILRRYKSFLCGRVGQIYFRKKEFGVLYSWMGWTAFIEGHHTAHWYRWGSAVVYQMSEEKGRCSGSDKRNHEAHDHRIIKPDTIHVVMCAGRTWFKPKCFIGGWIVFGNSTNLSKFHILSFQK